MLKVIQENSPWYTHGLRFECTGCGQCCTGAPGYIWVNEEEILQIAQFLKLTIEEFSEQYLRRVKGRLSLIELPKTYDCIFLKDRKCQIYPVRPTQCRTFPWWPQHLKSEKDWQEAARFCEGIRPEAPLIPIDTIEQQRLIQEEVNNRPLA
jgi:Fe-S-cluster containining protein